MSDDFEAKLDELLATCGCAACCRYRMSLLSRMAYWAAKIEESFGRKRAR